MPVCPYCLTEFDSPKEAMAHMQTCEKNVVQRGHEWTLFESGLTEIQEDPFAEELDMLENIFDDLLIDRTPEDGSYPTILADFSADGDAKRRLLVKISLVYGYPFVAPKVEISCASKDATFSQQEGRTLMKEIRELIQAGLEIGAPCVQQVLMTVQDALNNVPQSPLAGGGNGNHQYADPSTTKGSSGGNNNNNKGSKSFSSSGVSGKLQSINQAGKGSGQVKFGTSPPTSSNSLRQVSSMEFCNLDRLGADKEKKKLSVLVLHLLSRLCESDRTIEDSVSTFEALKEYLSADIGIIQENVVQMYCSGSVRSYFKSIIATANEQGPPLSWLWNSPQDGASGEGGKNEPVKAITAGPSGHSRFKQEFVQIKKLGEGGFAPVFMCRKKVDGRVYAIKRQFVKSEEAAKALREAQTLAALSHVNIVRYYDAWLEAYGDENPNSDSDEEEEEEIESSSSEDEFEYSPARNAASNFFAGVDDDDDEEEEEEEEEEESDDEEDVQTAQTSDRLVPEGLLTDGVKYHILYIQMELCHPRSLKDAISTDEVVKNEGIIATVLRQLLNVISHVHLKNMMHRDLKPDNVLFDAASRNFNGNIKVADFGLARKVAASSGFAHASSMYDLDALDALDDLDDDDDESKLADAMKNATVTKDCGTVLYCAPEQQTSETYGMTVDEYSIGMIAYEMWLGAAGKNFRERFDEMVSVRKTGRLPSWFTGWRPQVAMIIEKLIAVDPTERSTASEILKMAELPGEPNEIGVALDTCTKHMDRMIERVLQRNRANYLGGMLKFHRTAIDTSENFRAIQRHFSNLCGVFNANNAYQVSPFVPLTVSLDSQQCDVVTDDRGRCWCRTRNPLPALAFHLATTRRPGGELKGFYNHLTGDAMTPVTSNFFVSTPNPIVADAEVLSFIMQLLSLVVVQDGKMELHMSHASLFHILPRDAQEDILRLKFLNSETPAGADGTTSGNPSFGHVSFSRSPASSPTSRGYTSELLTLKAKINTEDELNTAMQKLVNTISVYIEDDRALEEMRAQFIITWKLVFSGIELLRNACLPVPELIFDPLLRPRDLAVHSTLRYGVLAEVLHTKGPVHRSIALCCRIEGLLPTFGLSDVNTHIANVSLDVKALADATTGVSTGGVNGKLQSLGVGVNDGNSVALFTQKYVDDDAVFEVLTQLRVLGIRSDRVALEHGWEHFCKSLKQHHFNWSLFVASDGLKLSRTVSKLSKIDIARATAGVSIRDHIQPTSTNSNNDRYRVGGGGKELKVQFVGREDSSSVQWAKDVYSDITHPLPNTIIAAPYSYKDIRLCIGDYLAASSSGGGGGGGGSRGGKDSGSSGGKTHAPTLYDFLRQHNSKELIPIFSTVDHTLELFVNNVRIHAKARRKDEKKQKMKFNVPGQGRSGPKPANSDEY